MFEKASKLKLRFKVAVGLITTEDLWNLSLEELNTLAKALNKEVKDASEESFIKTKSADDEILLLKFDIVKRVIEVKLAELEAKKARKDRKARNQQIIALMAKKENEALEGKSLDELRSLLEEDEE